MKPLDLLGTLFPGTAAKYLIGRSQFLHAKRLYEGVSPSQYRPVLTNRTSGDGVMDMTGSRLREYSRHLEENHDLVVSIFDDLVNNSIGQGAAVQPMVRTKDGKLAEAFNDELADLWMRWGQYADASGDMEFRSMERAVTRSMYRDGEVFCQQVIDNRYPHKTDLRLVLELIEADQCPFDFSDPKRNILHGIENNSWNKAIAYWLLKNHPGDPLLSRLPSDDDLKRVSSDDMLHVKFSRRLRQRRGVPVIHAVINRLRDVKDYEESERIAAKVAADMTAFIKRTSEYNGPQDVNTGGNREMQMQAGAIFFLQPGEDIGSVKSDRPNPNLEKFRSAMLRAVAGGTGTRYSSISRDYNGTYSAQRQELVEGAISYRANFAYIVSKFHRPVYERFVTQAMLSRQLKTIPRGLDMSTIQRVDFRAPALPWIDPSSEAKAYETLVTAGLESRAEVMRQRGRDPTKVIEEIIEETASGVFASQVQAVAPATTGHPEVHKPDEDDADAVAA